MFRVLVFLTALAITSHYGAHASNVAISAAVEANETAPFLSIKKLSINRRMGDLTLACNKWIEPCRTQHRLALGLLKTGRLNRKVCANFLTVCGSCAGVCAKGFAFSQRHPRFRRLKTVRFGSKTCSGNMSKQDKVGMECAKIWKALPQIGKKCVKRDFRPRPVMRSEIEANTMEDTHLTARMMPVSRIRTRTQYVLRSISRSMELIRRDLLVTTALLRECNEPWRISMSVALDVVHISNLWLFVLDNAHLVPPNVYDLVSDVYFRVGSALPYLPALRNPDQIAEGTAAMLAIYMAEAAL